MRKEIAIYEAAVKLRGLDCCQDKFYWCRKAFIGIETPYWIVEMPINSLEAPVILSRQKIQALEVLPQPHMYLYGVLEILCESSKLKLSHFLTKYYSKITSIES